MQQAELLEWTREWYMMQDVENTLRQKQADRLAKGLDPVPDDDLL